MSQIDARFAAGKLLIPYVMAGFPSLDASQKVITALADAGSKVIEIGIPYSDPLADGPTIQRASEMALSNNVNTEDVFALVERAAQDGKFSPVLMVYYNLIYRYGLERFAKRASAAGVEGLIVPDLAVEEAGEWRATAAKHRLDTIFLVAPTSSPERIRKITSVCSGFVYCVSLTGVTGARETLPANLIEFIRRVRAATDLPLAVGFGISNPEQAREVAAIADGVIIGSAFIDIIEQAGSIDEALAGVGKLAMDVIASLTS